MSQKDIVSALRAHAIHNPQIPDAPGDAQTRVACAVAADEIEKLRLWVVDLQAGTYVNCVYCGHRYGPGETTPVSMAEALRAHVEVCPDRRRCGSWRQNPGTSSGTLSPGLTHII